MRREADGPVVRIVGTHFDLTERKQAEEARERERNERARTELLGRMVFAQEDERRRIAREMHDQFDEQLTALGLRIRMLKEAAGGQADLADQIDALEQVAQQIDRDVDHLVWELRPTALDDLGFVDRYRAALGSRSAWRRAWAAERLGVSRAKKALPELERALSDRSHDVRLRAARAIQLAGGAGAVRHLMVALDRPDRWASIIPCQWAGIGWSISGP